MKKWNDGLLKKVPKSSLFCMYHLFLGGGGGGGGGEVVTHIRQPP